MDSQEYHLAEINVARMRAALTDPVMADFVAQLDSVNALADRSPGFVWRLQSEYGDATAIRAFEDDLMLVNISVWESVDALFAFTYRAAHGPVYAVRRQWFEPPTQSPLALWWIPAGTLPTIEEAKERLEHLHRHGPTAYAFTFRTRFPKPGLQESGVGGQGSGLPAKGD